MERLSRRARAVAKVRCGTYHRRGLKGCTSHHIRVDKLDELLKLYVQKVKDNSAAMLERLNADLAKEEEDVAETGLCRMLSTSVLRWMSRWSSNTTIFWMISSRSARSSFSLFRMSSNTSMAVLAARDKIFTVKVISNGDPLEIYTDREGGVIFKKYSQLGDVSVPVADEGHAAQHVPLGQDGHGDEDAVLLVSVAQGHGLIPN